jgi:signal transduction histidine kinase
VPPPDPANPTDPEALAHDLRTALTVASMGIQMAMHRVAADEYPGQERATDSLVAALAAIESAVACTQSLIDGIRASQAGERPP